MSFGKNVLASYVSHTYATMVAIVMVPIYIRYMGVEAYGLVGFFAMLQVWFQLLDMGLTPIMLRETARFNAGAIDALSLRRLLRTLEGIFISIAVLGGAAMMAGSGAIAGSWLNVQSLSLDEVQQAIMLMAAIIALRFVSSLYRGAINGFERLVWLNGLNIGVATARFVLVIPYFIYVGTSPTQFFSYQLVVALAEVIVLVLKTHRLLPHIGSVQQIPWQWGPLRGMLKFSLSFAFSSTAWALITQTDKLALSSLLTLEEYAYFTLAVIVASGVMVVSTPISYPLIPRLSKLSAAGDEEELIRLYRNATQIMGMIAVPAAVMLAFFSEQVLWAWTGNAEVTARAAPVLTLYALGNGILALAAFPYYLQFAKGDLKLHLIGSAIFVVTLIPALIFATLNYGAIGAGYAWLAVNAVSFLFWAPKVHRRFVKGLHVQWLTRDVGPAVCLTLAGAAIAQAFVQWPHERLSVAMSIAIVGVTLLALSAAGTAWMREEIATRWRTRYSR